MSIIAVTGVSGLIGQRLLARLEGDDAVPRVIGVDVAHPLAGSPKLEFHEADVREPRLAKILAGADVVVHLAFSRDAGRDPEEMRSVNVEGMRGVLEAADAAGAGKVIALSSAMTYGAHPDNPVPLDESAPPRPNEDFPFAVHKHEAERLIEERRARGDGVIRTVLRSAPVAGPTAESFLTRTLEAPRLTTVKGFEPPWQVVHEEDVAGALTAAIASDLDGVYNLAADGWLSAEDVTEISGKRRIEIPESVAFAMAERLWRAGLATSPPGELHYLMHPWVIDNAKLRATGWRPRYSNRATLMEAVESHRSWIALGRARVRKDSLAMGAAAALGAIGTMALVRRARKRGT